MAAGDISTVIVNANAVSGSFRVSEMYEGVPSAFETGKGAFLNLSSDGYTGTILTALTGWLKTIPIEFESAAFESLTTHSQSVFNVGSDTALGAFVPAIGTAWITELGTFTIPAATDRLTVATSAGGSTRDRAYVASGVSDARIATTMIANGSNRYAGVMFRRIDANNYWRWENMVGNTGVGSRLIKVVAGVDSAAIATVTGAGSVVVPTAPTSVEIVLNGTNIKVYLAGSLIVDYTDATDTHTLGEGHGICSNNQTANAFWTNFTISDIVGDVVVNWISQEPIHDADGVTLTADAGLVTDGTTTSNAATALSATNNSTLANFQPECAQNFVVQSGELLAPRSIIAGAFDFDVVATHGYGIAAVSVEFTDGVNSPVVSTQTAVSRSAFRDALYADFMESRGYTFTGNLGVYKFSGVDLSSLNDGTITATIKAYPNRGGSADIRTVTYKLTNNNGAAYTPATAIWVDSNGTLTVSSLSADIPKYALITGNTSGAKAVVAGDVLSGATSIPAYYMSGTFSATETLSIKSLTESEIATATFSSSSWLGSNANPGTSLSPLRTTTQAATNIVASATGSKYGQIKCKAGWHGLPVGGGNLLAEGYVEILPDDGLTVDDVALVPSGSASRVKFLKLKNVQMQLGRNYGTSRYISTYAAGISGLEDAIWCDGCTMTHYVGRNQSITYVNPINQSNFNDDIYVTNFTSTDHGTDGVTLGRVNARNVFVDGIGVQMSYIPRMIFALASTNAVLSPNYFLAQTGTITGSTPSAGDYAYQPTSGTWALLTEVSTIVSNNRYFFTPNPSGGVGLEASHVTDFTQSFAVAFYTAANFNAGTGLPTGSSLGSCNVGVAHPDGVQYSSTSELDCNSICMNVYIDDCEGQMIFSRLGDKNITFCNYLAVRLYNGSDQSQIGEDVDVLRTNKNIKVWNTAIVNQNFGVREPADYSIAGFQFRNVVAAVFQGGHGYAGCYDNNNVSRVIADAGADAVFVVDCFESSIGPTDDYSESLRDFRPSALMPTTDDVPWPYDMLGNALVGDGSDYVGAIQGTASATPTWQDIADSAPNTLTISNVQAGDYGRQFRRKIVGLTTQYSAVKEIKEPI